MVRNRENINKTITPEVKNPLLLEQCEAIIAEGLESIKKVERALSIIEQMKLYKGDFKDFESYYEDKWKENINLKNI